MINNRMFVFVSILVIIFTFYFCTSDNSTDPPNQNLKNYYPGGEGTTYKYNVEQQNSSGTLSVSTRSVNYGNEIEIGTVKYREQKDSIDDGNTVTENISYFRKTETGVFYFIDTTGFLSLVPDSIKNLISVQDEMRLLLNPLAIGSFWPVFRVTVNLQPGFSYSPIDINGYYVSQEDLILNLETGTNMVTAQKVKYDLDFTIDLNQAVQRFSAYAWFAEEIGIVKMDGSSVLINILLTGGLSLGDTTTIKQDLLSYDIK